MYFCFIVKHYSSISEGFKVYYIIKLIGFNYTVIIMSLGSSVRKSFHRTEHKHSTFMPKEATSLSCQPRLPHAQRLHKHLGSSMVTWRRELLILHFNFGGRVNKARLSLDPLPSFHALQTDTYTHFCIATQEGV